MVEFREPKHRDPAEMERMAAVCDAEGRPELASLLRRNAERTRDVQTVMTALVPCRFRYANVKTDQ